MDTKNETFHIKDSMLHIDGMSAAELVARHGSPLYVLSRSALARRIAELRTDVLDRYPNTRAAYASKAFLCIAMCEIIEAEGLALDVVSGGELHTAMKAGFPADRIEFHGNNKLPEELEMAIGYGVGRIIVDAPDELGIIEEIAARQGRRPSILFRINPEVEAQTHSHISTGFKGSKFGFAPGGERTLALLAAASASKHVGLLGIHCHVGSQLFDKDSHLGALATMLRTIKEARDLLGIETKELNIGGGFGIRYVEGEVRRPYAYFIDPVMAEVARFCQENSLMIPDIIIEPGRSIVGDAGVTLYTAGAVRDIPGVRKYVSIDGGMPDNIRPALYGARYEAIVANRADGPLDDVVTLAGKCCETGDRIIDDARLQTVRRGDIVAVFATGAYGFSMASNYNRLPIPAVVLVQDGASVEIVRRQTFDDMVAREISLREIFDNKVGTHI